MRPSSHAGSWYSAKPDALQRTVREMFSSVEKTEHDNKKQALRLKALISPHAGMSFSGHVASSGYALLSQYLQKIPISSNETIKFFIFGPAHAGFIGDECHLSAFESYHTPNGTFHIDSNVRQSLLSRVDNSFKTAKPQIEIKEHSIEMQLPYLSYALSEAKISHHKVKILPVLVGNLTKAMENYYAQVFTSYWRDKTIIFLFSGDFCHWGDRFGYTYHYAADQHRSIDDSIDAMDQEGLRHLVNKNPVEWYSYLKKTENTICGRHPFGILLHMIKLFENSDEKVDAKLLRYGKSNVCKDDKDSRVSYASMGIWT